MKVRADFWEEISMETWRCRRPNRELLQEEQNSGGSSANYDVELLHHKSAHEELEKTGKVNSLFGFDKFVGLQASSVHACRLPEAHTVILLWVFQARRSSSWQFGPPF